MSCISSSKTDSEKRLRGTAPSMARAPLACREKESAESANKYKNKYKNRGETTSRLEARMSANTSQLSVFRSKDDPARMDGSKVGTASETTDWNKLKAE